MSYFWSRCRELVSPPEKVCSKDIFIPHPSQLSQQRWQCFFEHVNTTRSSGSLPLGLSRSGLLRRVKVNHHVTPTMKGAGPGKA